RPLFAVVHPDHQDGIHAFFSLNMLGAAIGAPLVCWLADRTGGTRRILLLLALTDGILLVVCTLPLPLSIVLTVRCVQGAANVGALSILMGVAGTTRSPGSHGRGIGLAGAAVVAAIVAGAPLWTLLLAVSPFAPFYAAAACAFVVTASVGVLPATSERAPRGSRRGLLAGTPILRVPTLFIGAERFVVGCFVVTFSLYAHNVLGLSDGRVGVLFSWFLVPFAVLMWPMGALAMRLDRGVLLGAGALLYGTCFLLLGEVSAVGLPLLLALAGAASAAVYAPSLCVVAQSTLGPMRSTAMGLANAGGTLGMLLGTATAGIFTMVSAKHGLEPAAGYRWVFRIAGFVQLGVLVVGLPALRSLTRAATPVTISRST
ncbi:MAG: MFS transporter, partial [Proteobacteria bacterium]|nr:MFS transporter [Pseudomonadota bacterium]